MNTDTQTEIMISKSAVEAYAKADQEIARTLGKAPGPQVLMALVLEREDPMELAQEYCELLLGSAATQTKVLAL